MKKVQFDRLVEEGIIKIEKQPLVNTYLGSLTQEQLEDKDNLKLILGIVYEKIVNLLKVYVDMDEKYYKFTALWIIGTYFHDEFNTFPILHINAMRGSGKTRFLNLISALSKDGLVTTSLKEAVLFRLGKKTLCIDEFEGVGNKEFQNIRELLNSCYKKGLKVLRNKKVRRMEGETYEIEEFEPYKPVAIANIQGMEEILEDRSITIILEKSDDKLRTKLREDFENHPIVLEIKSEISKIQKNLVLFLLKKGIIEGWNKYLFGKYGDITTLTTLTTLTTQDIETYSVEMGWKNVVSGDYEKNEKSSQETTLNNLSIYNRIDDTGISGRNLELMLPFFELSSFLSDTLFEKTLLLAKQIIDEKKEREFIESRDVCFIDFIAHQGINRSFSPIKQITSDFKHYMADEEGDEKWINPKWVGKALKRLKLAKDKKRASAGVEVMIDIDNAIKKMRLFQKEKKNDILPCPKG
jgi:hypothetical protein